MKLPEWDWVAIAAATAAWLAAWQAFRSSRIARHSYRLALRQEQRLEPSLEVYIVDAHIVRLTRAGKRIYVFRITIANKSFAANALKELQLIIHYSGDQMHLSSIAIPHQPEWASSVHQILSDVLEIPSSVAAHTVIGGVALFQLYDEVLETSKIESYTVKLVDTYGNQTEREAILLQERRDESLE